MLGTVKWFNDEKGYGFVAPDGGGDDVFVHHSAITGMSGRRTLFEGQAVEFDTKPGRKSLEAVDLRVTD